MHTFSHGRVRILRMNIIIMSVRQVLRRLAQSNLKINYVQVVDLIFLQGVQQPDNHKKTYKQVDLQIVKQYATVHEHIIFLSSDESRKQQPSYR